MKVQLLIKRILDFTAALLALIVLSPLMLLAAVLVFVKLGAPIFFYHVRPGRNGRLFKMIKFKSLLNPRESQSILQNYEERLTPFGRALRSTSLDELPELVNVLKGDMSLVGPRPLLTQYLPLYNERQMKRHSVRPGITGWAQVNGRNAISWDQKFDYDIWYVENWSLFLDLKILLMTIWKVFRKEGVNQSESINMEFWTGNRDSFQTVGSTNE